MVLEGIIIGIIFFLFDFSQSVSNLGLLQSQGENVLQAAHCISIPTIRGQLGPDFEQCTRRRSRHAQKENDIPRDNPSQ